MTEAIFGLIGVLIGSVISWFQTYWITKRDENKNAKYLAIRVVCILDKYMEDCTEVVYDDGLSCGQRTADGSLQSQIQRPSPPLFPEDVDWKSIEHELMYKILSFSSDIRQGDKMIDATNIITGPPDYQEFFDERKYQYAKFAIVAFELSFELASIYNIKKKTYNDWDPLKDMQQELNIVSKRRDKRIISDTDFVKRNIPEN